MRARRFNPKGGPGRRIEDVLYFPRRDGRPGPVSAHANIFHQILETVPAAGWQVQQDQDGLSVSLAGLQDDSVCEPLGAALRRTLEMQGASVGRFAFAPWTGSNAGSPAKRR